MLLESWRSSSFAFIACFSALVSMVYAEKQEHNRFLQQEASPSPRLAPESHTASDLVLLNG